jgi:hypothetical protein
MINKGIVFPSILLFSVAVLTLSVADHEGAIFFAKLAFLASLVVPVFELVLRKTIGSEKSKALLVNLLLLGITLMAGLISTEYMVRYLFNDITTTGDNTSYFALRWKRMHAPVVNRLGFREREIAKQKPANVYRIAVVGDSFTYGQGITEEERFSKVIERKLNNAKGGYEVLNFGKPGAETIDHIGFLDDVLALDPDFVMLQWFSNDVEGHDKSARPRPYHLIPSDYLSGLLHRNSALFYLVNNQWNALQSRLGIVATYEESMITRFGDPESDNSRRADHELEEFILRVKNNGIPVGVVLFPRLVETGGNIENYPFGFLFDRVIDVCRENDIHYLDMRPVFAGITPASELRVNRFDAHPSAYANEIAAEAILESFSDQW